MSQPVIIGDATLYLGKSEAVLKTMPDSSVDSIVCDPPYELGFMGKSWDSTGIAYNVDMWRECLRVLKPGGHLLAFSGTRTYHRMACAIEDAGFEIRDQIQWIYGSGFPKNLDVSKAIDKAAGVDREVIGQGPNASRRPNPIRAGSTFSDDACVWGQGDPLTAPATEAAKQWEGWGTALKPAHEPICVARKPLIGTVAANVLQFGTGAINIDGCRVPGQVPVFDRPAQDKREIYGQGLGTSARSGGMSEGRWPANVILDGSDEVVALFPDAPGQQRAVGPEHGANASVNVYGDYGPRDLFLPRLDSGSAARFFYCAKTSREDRNEGCEHMERKPLNWSSGDANPGSFQSEGTDKTSQNNHPTVKPTELMRYLVRLVTPPGGTVLDPFMGSGSTGKACAFEDFKFIGIDMTPEYVAIAKARIEHAQSQWVQRELIA